MADSRGVYRTGDGHGYGELPQRPEPGDRRNSHHSELTTSEFYEDEQPGCCDVKEWFEDFTSVYQTQQKLRIRSRLLKIPYVFTNAFLFVFIICYKLVYQLEIMESTQTEGSSTVWISEPKTNYWTCSNTDIDCKMQVKNNTDLPYCNGTYEGRVCEHFDRHVVAMGKFTSQLWIATNIETFEQYKSKDAVDWTTKSTRKALVKGIEDYMLQIQHAFTTAEDFRSYSNFDSQGFLAYRASEDEITEGNYEEHPWVGRIKKLERMPCAKPSEANGMGAEGFHVESVACSAVRNIRSYSSSWDEMNHCQTSKDFIANGLNPICMKTQFGDYIALRKVLEAAGIGSLDAVDPFLKARRRLTGVALVMEITIVNDDPKDFWRWPFGRKMKYFYTFYETALDPAMSGISFSAFQFRNTVPEDNGYPNTHRILRQTHGIPIIVRTRVHFREFSMFRTFAALFVCATALQISKMFVEKLLVRTYRWSGRCAPCQRCGYVSLTFRFFTKRNAPNPDDCGPLILNREIGKLHHHEREAHESRIHSRNSMNMPYQSSQMLDCFPCCHVGDQGKDNQRDANPPAN